VVGGLLLISACLLTVLYLNPGVFSRAALLMLLYAAILWKLKPTLTMMWSMYRKRHA
jgi:hypothetical protein